MTCPTPSVSPWKFTNRCKTCKLSCFWYISMQGASTVNGVNTVRAFALIAVSKKKACSFLSKHLRYSNNKNTPPDMCSRGIGNCHGDVLLRRFWYELVLCWSKAWHCTFTNSLVPIQIPIEESFAFHIANTSEAQTTCMKLLFSHRRFGRRWLKAQGLDYYAAGIGLGGRLEAIVRLWTCQIGARPRG